MLLRKRRRQVPTVQRPDLTPMIDVTFLLLVFFMLTIHFKTLDQRLEAFLPKDVGGNPTPQEPVEKVVIRIEVAGDPAAPTVQGAERALRYRVGPFATTSRAELRRRLETLRQADPELKCSIDAREGVTYGDTVSVLDDTNLSGFREVSFVGHRGR